MIYVFGSLNADFFLPVDAFPKAGETVLTPFSVVKAGGKGGNQAVAAAKAGAIVTMLGAVGNDDAARVPLAALKRAGVDCSCVRVSEKSTGMAMVMVDSSGENSIVVAGGANMDVSADQVSDDVLKRGGLLITQMEVSPDETGKMILRAKKRGLTTVLNIAPAKPVSLDVLRCVDYLILNEIETQTIYESLFFKKAADTQTAVSEIAGKTGGVCLATLGKKGVIAVKDGSLIKTGCLAITPVDTTGAGDAFVGIFSAMIDGGADLKAAMRAASAGAGLACLKIGAQEALPTKDEIIARVQEIEQD